MGRSASKTAVLYTYSTTHLNKSDLVRFYYALKGRDGRSGVLKSTKTKFLTKSVLLCGTGTEKETKDFLKHWHCKITRTLLKLDSKKPTAALVIYSTKGLSNTNLVRLYYALKGRDGKSGIVKLLNIKQLAKGALVVKDENLSELKSFFRHWLVPIKSWRYSSR